MTATLAMTANIPVPAGRGRWRVTLHRRDYTAAGTPLGQTVVADLAEARGRRLEKQLNAPAQATFTLDGADPAAALVLELATEVVFWRWSTVVGRDIAMFRGVVDHSEDQVTEESAVVTFTAHDYAAMLTRRIATGTISFVQTDQDTVVTDLIGEAGAGANASDGTAFSPGSNLPLRVSSVNPDGTNRSPSGQLRDRTYLGNQNLGTAVDDLAHVINGFDYDVIPYRFDQPYSDLGQYDLFRVWYPQQGVSRTDVALQYGSTVSAFTRTVASSDYANYVRMLGNNQSSDPTVPQVFAEAWNSDANNVTVNPVGLWMAATNGADVTIQSTLSDQANGYLNLNGILVPSYTVTMRPDAYRYGYPNMGDTVPLIADVGRLNVNTTVRVVGVAYDIGEDGDENVVLTVGRPATTLAKYLSQGARDIDALARR